MANGQNSLGRWSERLAALRNVPPVLRIVWQAGPLVVSFGLFFRLISSLVPLAALWVPKLIIDRIAHALSTHETMPRVFWWLVAAEFGIAILGSILARTIDYLDALLADKYTRHISIRVMEHAANLDLTAYEDPVFYDRLERARVQATDRLGMIQSIGRLVQQVITGCSLSVSILLFSRWLWVLLIVGILPAFLGESHFAFLGYARNFRQTPIRRELDYLRVLGGSREGAKELKLFGLKKFLVERFTRLSDQIYVENVALARRRLIAGSFLSMIGTAGYYSAYVYVIWRTVSGSLSIGTLIFLTGAIVQASSNIQLVFSTMSSIADQALFLTDLLAFFRMEPTIHSKPNALPAPRPIMTGFEFRNVSFRYPGTSRLVLNNLDFHLRAGERVALIGENGGGKTTLVKLMTRLYDPTEGQILLDGVDLREYVLADLYRAIRVIFHDFMRYEMSARENIAVGRIGETDNLPLLRTASVSSLSDAVIQKLPCDHQQMIGRLVDGGVARSGEALQ